MVISLVISLKQLVKPAAGIILILALIISAWTIFLHKTNKYVIGGLIHSENRIEQNYSQPVTNIYEFKDYDERFQRPSKQPALKLKYSFDDFKHDVSHPPYILNAFESPEDVIQAYYAILKEAANMDGHCGGCGTVGMAKTPFPYAYDLLTNETKQKITIDEYIASFLGVGHTTLLKLIPAYAPLDTPENIKYHLVEIEIITAPKCSEIDGKKKQPSCFSYYYGLVTTELTDNEGWKIKAVDYIPEDFLCAPYHQWYWDSPAVVQIIYGDWYKLIDGIEKVDKEDSNIKIYAKGGHNKYRFDVVRLTNGEDIFIHEYVWENGEWKEVEYIAEQNKYQKFYYPYIILNRAVDIE